MSDDQIERMWPDAEQRAARRAKLHETLDVFLDTFVEAEGGWAMAEQPDVSVLREIIQEIADLKFQRDGDGDSVINFHVVNRRRGRLISTFVPYQPRDRDGAEPVTARDTLTFIRESVRAARYLISSGEDVLRTLDYDFEEVEKALPPVVRLADAEATVIAAFGSDLSWKDAQKAIGAFQDGYPDAKEAQDRVIDAYLDQYGDTPEFATACAEVIDLLDADKYDDARQMLSHHRQEYGFGMRPATRRFNEVSRDRQAARMEAIRAARAAEKAGEPA